MKCGQHEREMEKGSSGKSHYYFSLKEAITTSSIVLGTMPLEIEREGDKYQYTMSHFAIETNHTEMAGF